ncbi:hypothetical protein [Xanthobacter pseudotagetidis]|uniref:hypothetical protein n=1 Tax=Xanthobacter pseudotagetidis TaxID=3119911 RepID=UPI00372CB330
MLDIVVRMVSYLASFGILGGLILAAVAAGARVKARRVAGWPSIKVHIVEAPAPPGAFGSLARGLRYRYQVDGRLHENARLTLLDWPAGVWPDAAAFAPRYRAGGYVDAFINPKLSDDVLLDRTMPPARAVHLGLTVAIACTLVVLARRLLV